MGRPSKFLKRVWVIGSQTWPGPYPLLTFTKVQISGFTQGLLIQSPQGWCHESDCFSFFINFCNWGNIHQWHYIILDIQNYNSISVHSIVYSPPKVHFPTITIFDPLLPTFLKTGKSWFSGEQGLRMYNVEARHSRSFQAMRWVPRDCPLLTFALKQSEWQLQSSLHKTNEQVLHEIGFKMSEKAWRMGRLGPFWTCTHPFFFFKSELSSLSSAEGKQSQAILSIHCSSGLINSLAWGRQTLEDSTLHQGS